MRMPSFITGMPLLAAPTLPAALTLLWTVTLLATTAQAGVVLEYTAKSQPSGKSDVVERYYAQDGMMRVESVDAATGAVDRVHLLRDGAIYDLEPRTKTYRRMDPQTVKSLMGAQNERMQAMMAQLPPERRALMQQRLAQLQGGGGTASLPTYSDTGRSDHAGSYACRIWTEEQSGHETAEYCVAAVSSLPGGSEFAASMKNALDTVHAIGASVQAARAAERIERIGKMNGVPIRSRRFSTSGAVEHESVLSAARSQSLSAEQFAVPAGYTEKPFAKEAAN